MTRHDTGSIEGDDVGDESERRERGQGIVDDDDHYDEADRGESLFGMHYDPWQHLALRISIAEGKACD